VSKVRVLNVEDFLPFQKMIGWVLQQMPNLEVVGTAADGVEAIQKAQELQSDLIIMDIGLPKLNGLEAAREILKVSPQCKVIFLTQEASVGVIENAFQLGARGYVIKDRLVKELSLAVRAVLDGKRFVSSGIVPDSSVSLFDSELESTQNFNKEIKSATLPAQPSQARCHELQVYSNETILLDSAARFVKAAIGNGESVLLMAGETVRSSLFLSLQPDGIDRVAVAQRGSYISLDAREMISLFMVNGMPDAVRFVELLGGLFAAAAEAAPEESRNVAAFCECASLLWAEGKTQAAFRVEQLYNEVASRYQVKLLCAYSVANFDCDQDFEYIQKLCLQHSAVHSE
jgi:DNA-binding NarL/FixJ family response regulator